MRPTIISSPERRSQRIVIDSRWWQIGEMVTARVKLARAKAAEDWLADPRADAFP